MSTTITLEEAQVSLTELVHRMAPGEKVVTTENQKPVARLVSEHQQPTVTQRPGPGLLKGIVTYLTEQYHDRKPTCTMRFSQ